MQACRAAVLPAAAGKQLFASPWQLHCWDQPVAHCAAALVLVYCLQELGWAPLQMPAHALLSDGF